MVHHYEDPDYCDGDKCGFRSYFSSDFKRIGNKRYCEDCFKKIDEKTPKQLKLPLKHK